MTETGKAVEEEGSNLSKTYFIRKVKNLWIP